MKPDDHVAIVGGGFSGTLLAINLLRHDGPRVTMIERSHGQIARGVAYSAAHPHHLLNVRAANMSALPDDPSHFVRWLEVRGGGDAGSFVPRSLYGEYLRGLLDEARAIGGDRLRIIADEARDIGDMSGGVAVRLRDGPHIRADYAVLAVGNLPPHTPPGIDPDALPADAYRADPWAGDLANGLADGDTVLLLGTGLTAIDAALLLDAAGFAGRIMALSRRGLRPRPHASGAAAQGLREKPATTLSHLVQSVRREAEVHGWRAAIDALRPITQMLWGGADDETRARFLRHLRPYWDVHRHRLAPQVAETVDAMVTSGRLRFIAGKIAASSAHRGGARVVFRPRYREDTQHLDVRRIINCTGPQGDLTRSDDVLLRTLLASGTIWPDALRLGLDVDASSRVITAKGPPHDRLFAVGPMTRGGLWEVVAVPDLRVQTWTLARRLSNAHWVGGEGL
jgi:uncharacterized NAD(P)/FAD-binding protein YdhS